MPQLLEAADYHSREQFQREWETLFLPGWHFAAADCELPDDGSFVTVQFAGVPILCWRKDGQLHAFLNVCPHRSALLTSKPRGRALRMKCQYHGWEFDPSGRTRRIPDAGSFRPLDDGPPGLTKLLTARCGRLLFVAFCPPGTDSPCIAASSGLGEELFSARHQLIHSLDFEVAANWKVVVENALESYHVECVHQRTFQQSPPAETCQHRLEEGWNSFTTVAPPAGRMQRMLDKLAYRSLGLTQEKAYRHYLFLPNVMLSKAGMFSVLHAVLPLDTNRSQVVYRLFCERPRRNHPLA